VDFKNCSDHACFQDLVCHILIFYGFSCKKEFTLSNGQRIDVAGGMKDYTYDDIGIEIEYESPDPMNDIQKLQNSNFKVKVIISKNPLPIPTNAGNSGINVVPLPSKQNRQFEDLIKRMFGDHIIKYGILPDQYFDYDAFSGETSCDIYSKILNFKKLNVNKDLLEDIIYQKAIKGDISYISMNGNEKASAPREYKIEELLDLKEELYLYSYMELFGKFSSNEENALINPFNISSSKSSLETYNDYQIMKSNIDCIRKVIENRFQRDSTDIQDTLKDLTQSLWEIILLGSYGTVLLPNVELHPYLIKSYGNRRIIYFKDSYLELISYGGYHLNSEINFTENLKYIALLSKPFDLDAEARLISDVTNSLRKFVDLNIGFMVTEQLMRFPSLDLFDLFFHGKRKVNLNSEDVIDYLSWWVIWLHRGNESLYNPYPYMKIIDILIRNLGLQVRDIQHRLEDLGNQGIIALRNQLDYGILAEEEFNDFTLGRMRDLFNRIIY